MSLKTFWANLTFLGRAFFSTLAAFVIIGISYGVYTVVTPGSQSGTATTSGGGSVFSRVTGAIIPGPTPVKVCVNIWGGFAGGQYYNNGFAASKESRFWKEQGVLVEYVMADDFDQSRATWKAGGCDLLWATVDSFAAEADGLSDQKPKVPFQVDWSRGGDLVMAVEEIKSVNDLRGQTLSFAFDTPSHSLGLWLLNNSGLKPGEVKIVQVKDEKNSVAAFKGGNVKAAIMWSPDDVSSSRDVPRSHVLVSTKQATNIIADVFVVHADWLESNRSPLEKVYHGWMVGNAELSNDSAAREKAAQITAQGYGVPVEDMRVAISNVRFTTHGDNVNFFGLNPGYTGMTAENLFVKTGELYKEFFRVYPNQAMGVNNVPLWRTIADTRIVSAVNDLQGSLHAAEGTKRFEQATPDIARAAALSTKKITVNFETNSAALDGRNKSVIDRELVDIVRQFRENYIRIAGNTDSTGNYAYNKRLGKQRIDSVVNYLVGQYGFDPNRFVPESNGPDKPVCDESKPGTLTLDQCRAQNRRTEFQVLSR